MKTMAWNGTFKQRTVWPDGGKVALELNHKYDSSALWRVYSGFQKFLNIIKWVPATLCGIEFACLLRKFLLKVLGSLSPNSFVISCFRTVCTASGMSLLSDTENRHRSCKMLCVFCPMWGNDMCLYVPPLKNRTKHWWSQGWSGSNE